MSPPSVQSLDDAEVIGVVGDSLRCISEAAAGPTLPARHPGAQRPDPFPTWRFIADSLDRLRRGEIDEAEHQADLIYATSLRRSAEQEFRHRNDRNELASLLGAQIDGSAPVSLPLQVMVGPNVSFDELLAAEDHIEARERARAPHEVDDRAIIAHAVAQAKPQAAVRSTSGGPRRSRALASAVAGSADDPPSESDPAHALAAAPSSGASFTWVARTGRRLRRWTRQATGGIPLHRLPGHCLVPGCWHRPTRTSFGLCGAHRRVELAVLKERDARLRLERQRAEVRSFVQQQLHALLDESEAIAP